MPTVRCTFCSVNYVTAEPSIVELQKLMVQHVNANHTQELRLTPRPDWDAYFLGIAKAVSARGDCTRRQVGAILVTMDRRHRGSGYNGSYSGGPSCLAGACPRGASGVAPGSSYDTGPGACIAVHAEQNLCLDTTPEERKNGTVYITDEPCDACYRMLRNSGVNRIVWPDGEYDNFCVVSN